MDERRPLKKKSRFLFGFFKNSCGKWEDELKGRGRLVNLLSFIQINSYLTSGVVCECLKGKQGEN